MHDISNKIYKLLNLYYLKSQTNGCVYTLLTL